MGKLGQRLARVEHFGLQRLLAGESEQLAHQIRRAVGVLADLHDVGEGRVAGLMAQQQQIAKTDHRRQQVVEIVRHSARKLADRLHLLGLRELRLESPLFGHVEEVQDRRAFGAGDVVERPGVDRHGDVPTRARVEGAQAQGQTVGRVARDGVGGEFPQAPRQILAIFRRHAIGQRPADRRLAVRRDQFAEGGVGFGQATVRIDERYAHRRVLEEPAERPFAAA